MAESIASNGSKLKPLKLESVVWIVVIFFTVSIPFLMTVIALVHIEDCPHQPYIPLVVLMAGISMSLSNIINAADKYSPPKQTSYKKRKRIVGILNLITNCFTFTCFLTGAFWIYGKGTPSFNKKSTDFCNPSLYEFAFWLLNLSLILLGILFVTLLIAFSIKCIKKYKLI